MNDRLKVAVLISGRGSNMQALVRKVVELKGLDYAAPAPFDKQRPLGAALLEPTRIYVKSCLAAIRGGGVHALAHITGGGLIENLPRVLPDGLAARLDAAAWPQPPVFEWLADSGGIARHEMHRTFNCGIGMALIVAPASAAAATAALTDGGETVYEIGRIVKRGDGPRVNIENHP